jgi:hypothetical protein
MTAAQTRRLIEDVLALERREQALDETLWAPDLLAQRCGLVIEDLWDSLNTATDRWAVLERIDIPELGLPELGPARSLPHGVAIRQPAGGGQAAGRERWPALLAAARQAGWAIAQVEFRHNRFEIDARGVPRSSRYGFAAHLTNRQTGQRAALSGDLAIGWIGASRADAPPAIGVLDASRLVWSERTGPPPFELAFEETVQPVAGTHFIDPLLLHDLDGDGHSEIILAARNLVYRWHGWGGLKGEPLCRDAPGLLFTAVLADFDGDGADDLLGARFAGLVLFRGSVGGRFDRPGEPAWSVEPHLRYGQVLTCGDVDGDGDLDVWLGQYKGPYGRGQMPTPYYDANDGNPAYLLLNDGTGRFTDATAGAGVAAKRWRRSYSGSLVDLDQDGRLDLVVVSDFAGVDIHRNAGQGRFADVTAAWLPEPHAFGMAHALADFDGDGRLDLLVTGMGCPTPHRLDALGLSRSERPEYGPMRARMAGGNRLYQGRENTGFNLSPLGASVAQSGWSWGCAAADFDNDGHPDVAIVNGHETKQNVQDYEPEFWRHDIYVGGSSDDAVANGYFAAKQSRTRGQGMSYGGYEKNRFYLNIEGREFIEVGHLMGVALEADSRCCAADDLDGDGRPDLLITTFEVWPVARQTLRIFRNRIEAAGNWVGLQLTSAPGAPSPVGTRVVLEANGRRQVRAVVAGDSHRTQHGWTVRFGLGSGRGVDRVEVRWPTGPATVLDRPEANRDHRVMRTAAGATGG